MQLSFVVPLYNEGAVFVQLRAALESFAQRHAELNCEFVLVDDGSRDDTFAQLTAWAQTDPRVQAIALSRNFGHQIAATAGLDHARGEAIILMDGDLQDPPEVVEQMLAKYREGFDIVYAQRLRREGEPVLKRFTAWLFYRLMRLLVHAELPPDTGDFRLLSRAAANGLAGMRERHRFLRGMVTWMGFRQTAVQFVRPARAAGATKFPLSRMLSFAWNAAVSFSDLPLRLGLWLGGATALAGVAYACLAAYQALVLEITIPGWASLAILNCLIGGSILFCIGLMGEYLGRIFDEVKARPLYFIRDHLNGSPPVPPRAGPAPSSTVHEP